ncbi:hypothetical protein AB0F93_00070 [Micromonospora tulbaghiae]|uniref:hypothetical protein n=1 Tax=Micromonospora tulbaghiae TaxID=479978 RepID=UPI003328C99C
MAGTSPAKKTTGRKATAAARPRRAAAGGVFDLDALTKAQALPDLELPEKPFEFRLAGHLYQLTDPRDRDWKDAWRLAGNPFMLMRECLVGADAPVTDPTEQEIEHARERIRLGRADDEQDGEQDGEETKAEPPVEVLLIDRFTASPLPGWLMNALLENWSKYFKFDLTDSRNLLDALLGRTTATDE